ncbi:SURF1 family cytochrome oxidase biogenesis protein [Paramicrobacterium agarici]|uniref:SURF1-like protein n=1 Tax=Paramicrobacterium agarici TaxID=630514 RepID=A0A2A9DXS0_9MICO|nr:SURF1 family protein [Microbacterium agarici]PFG31383.1 cytochrome oxidase assembly protein ShyY1 [Microbacterium agarici]
MSRSWSFAFSWRWVGYLAVAIVFAIVCGFLSNWQVNRLHEKEHVQALVDSNWSADPVPLDQVVADPADFDDSHEYQPVTMTGEYLIDEQVLVRNRPRSGRPGFEVITPLKLESGLIFMVDRGWVPTGNEQDRPDSIPAPPDGQVTVTARVKPGEPELPGRSASGDQIATIHLPDLASRVSSDSYTAAYGLLVSENPAPQESRPLPAFQPEINQGMHLSYAIQWVIFALLAFAFLAYAVRQEYRQRNADDPRVRERAEERERKRRQKRTDADVEDEILDAVR